MRKKAEYISALAPAIGACLDYREQRGFERKTYEVSLHSLDRFYAESYPVLTKTTKDAVLDWITSREKVGNAQRMIDGVAVRQLGEYLLSVGEDAYILPYRMLPKVTTRTMPYIFTDDELSAFFAAADSLKRYNFKYKRFELIVAPVLFRLIYTCGLRPNEARELKREDVNLETGEILIKHTKNHKERIVVMSDDMLGFFNAYMQKLNIYIPGGRYCFPYISDKPYKTEQQAVLFQRCWLNAHPKDTKGSCPRVRVYDLRHRFASKVLHNWLDEGRDIYAMLPYLRAYMGHEDISATAYYIHLLPDNIVKSRGVDWIALNNILPEVDYNDYSSIS